jgi:DNA-binding NarL/FixJ family response regulator
VSGYEAAGGATFARDQRRKWHDATLHVLVCDEFSLFRRQLVLALEAAPDIEIVGEAGDSEAALDLATSGAPDVVFVGIQLPPHGGLRTASAIREVLPLTEVVVAFDPDERGELLPAVKAGASAFVPRESVASHAAAVTRSVAARRPILTRGAAAAVLQELSLAARPAGSADQAPGARPVDERERAVLSHLAEGESFAQAAGAVDVDVGAAATLVRNALLKVERRARTELAAATVNRRSNDDR